MGVTFRVAEAPRVYVERIDINGNTHDPRQGRPPRVPPRRGRSVQQRPRSALARPHPVARLLPGQSSRSRRPRARRRTGSSSTSTSRSSATGQLQLSAGYSSLERFLINVSVEQRNFRGPGPEGPRRGQLFAAIPSRSSSASPSPICSTATSRSASISSAATSTASTCSATSGPPPIQQVTTGGQIRAGVPLTERMHARAALRPLL